ncbi:hypothetical protein D3C75_552540 [compost metagenome]
MDEAGAEHAHHVADHLAVIDERLLGRERHVVEAGRHVAVGVRDELHQEHAVQTDIGGGHPHAGGSQLEQGIHLGVLPHLFVLLATVLGALLHGAGAAAVAHLAPFLIDHGLLEAALGGLFIDFGAADLVAAAHHIDVGFFAAHQPADDIVDQAVINQRLDSIWNFHDRPFTLFAPCLHLVCVAVGQTGPRFGPPPAPCRGWPGVPCPNRLSLAVKTTRKGALWFKARGATPGGCAGSPPRRGHPPLRYPPGSRKS